jgi:hypothetical protein
MQMNKQKHQRPARCVLLGCLLLTGALFAPVLAGAENEPPAQAEAEPVAKQQQAASAEAVTDKTKTQQAAGQAPAAGDAAARPVQQFKPTDKIGADSAVSFPVDI